jgi:hypothetical protein
MMDLMTEIKNEIIDIVLSHKDVFLQHGIILEDFDFEIGKYEKLLKEPFLRLETLDCYLRIPLRGPSVLFEFAVFLNIGFEPRIGYDFYKKPFISIDKPEILLEVPFSDSFVEDNFEGNWLTFWQYATPILEEYFKKEEVEMLLGVVGSVVIEIEPYIKYMEIII